MPLFRPDQIATDASDGDGNPCGPCKENARDAEARYLVIGTRSSGDTVTCPDHDRILHFGRESGGRRWTDHSGQPANSPYRSATD